jgi:hypothetical protein
MTNSINLGIDLTGILMGIIFIWLQLRAVRTLIGSAFKKNYYWVLVGAGFFALSFVADMLSMAYGDQLPWEIVHHLLLLISAVIFIAANLRLPQEASRYMKLKSEEGGQNEKNGGTT